MDWGEKGKEFKEVASGFSFKFQMNSDDDAAGWDEEEDEIQRIWICKDLSFELVD